METYEIFIASCGWFFFNLMQHSFGALKAEIFGKNGREKFFSILLLKF